MGQSKCLATLGLRRLGRKFKRNNSNRIFGAPPQSVLVILVLVYSRATFLVIFGFISVPHPRLTLPIHAGCLSTDHFSSTAV